MMLKKQRWELGGAAEGAPGEGEQDFAEAPGLGPGGRECCCLRARRSGEGRERF